MAAQDGSPHPILYALLELRDRIGGAISNAFRAQYSGSPRKMLLLHCVKDYH